MAVKFFKCTICGNVVEKLVDSGVKVVCCGKQMEELIPNTIDASEEKHLPVVTPLGENKIKVEIGSVAHPMTKEHHIAFIYVEYEDGGIHIDLPYDGKPEAVICTCGRKPIAVYEYCNLHGLWKIEM